MIEIKNLVSRSARVALLLFALCLFAPVGSALASRTIYLRGWWANFSVLPQRVSPIGAPMFVASDNRGGGSLFFTTSSQNGTLFASRIPPYAFRWNSSPPVPNRPPVRVTLDANGDLCPVWYSPPAEVIQVTCPLQHPSQNQTTKSDRFSLSTTRLGLDNEGRLFLHADALQLLTRFDVPASMISDFVAGVTDTIEAAVPAFPMSLAWGRFCNKSHIWHPTPYNNTASEFPVNSGPSALMLDDLMNKWNIHEPTFLNDGRLLFVAGSFPCVLVATPSAGWRVSWFAGNCSADQLDPFRDAPDYLSLGAMPQTTDIGDVVSLHYDPVDDVLYVASTYGVVLMFDVKTNLMYLVLGNVSAPFRQKALVCQDDPCSLFESIFPFVQSMSAWRDSSKKKDTTTTTTTAPSNAVNRPKLPSRLTATRLFIFEQAFQTVYQINLEQQNLLTEMTVITTHAHSGGGDDAAASCRPQSLVASDADLFVMCGDRKTVMRKRLLADDPAPEPTVPLPALDVATIETMTALTAFIALVSLPTVALTAGRTRSVIALVRCEVTQQRGTPLSWAESPTQLPVHPADHPDSEFRFVAGAVIGNICLLICAPVLIHYIVVRVLASRNYVQQRRTYDEKQEGGSLSAMLLNVDPPPNEERVRIETEASLRFPSATFVFAMLFTLEPTVRSCAFLIRFTHDTALEPRERWAFAIGVVGAVVTFLSFIFLGVFFLYHFNAVFIPKTQEGGSDEASGGDDTVPNVARRSASRSKNAAVEAEKTVWGRCAASVRRMYKWYKRRVARPYGTWRDLTFKQEVRWGGIIKPFTERGGKYAWLLVGEISSVSALAALVGAKTYETCQTTTIVAFVILTLFFFSLICLRPMASPLDNMFLSIVAGFNMFAALCALIAVHHHDDDVRVAGNSLAETLALAGAFLIGIHSFIDMMARLFKFGKFLLSKCFGEDNKKKDNNGDGNNNNNNKAPGDRTPLISAIQHDPFAQPTSAPMIVDNLLLANSSSSGMGSREASSMNTKSTKSSGKSNQQGSPSPGASALFGLLTNQPPSTPHASSSETTQSRQASEDFDLHDAVAKHEAKLREEAALQKAFAELEAESKKQQQQPPSAKPVRLDENDDEVFSQADGDLPANLNSQYALDDDSDVSEHFVNSSDKMATDEKKPKKHRTQLMEYEILREQLRANLDQNAEAARIASGEKFEEFSHL